MGANNVIPTVPAFVAGSPTVADLNRLSYAVSFLVDLDVRPTWKVFMAGGTQTITANTWTNVSFSNVAYDCDGVASLPNVVVVTQGYYSLESCVQVQAGANKDEFVGAFLLTTGANNPHYTPGTLVYFGYAGNNMSQTGSAAADNTICLSAATPVCLYPLDKLNVQVYTNANHTVDYNVNTSYIQGRFSTCFTGSLCRLGT